MKLFGIKPYRRRGRKPVRRSAGLLDGYPNLIRGSFPIRAGQVWVSDFTYLPYRGSFVYLATILDLYSRQVVGWHLSTSHDTPLVSAALFDGLTIHRPPQIIHSDQGVEYRSKAYTELANRFNIQISMSRKASPWENGYQESFFSQFKVDLGDPNRFATLPELIEYIHLRIYIYNQHRIHTSLKMSPNSYLRARSH
jgi:transposase InsO family protein